MPRQASKFLAVSIVIIAATALPEKLCLGATTAKTSSAACASLYDGHKNPAGANAKDSLATPSVANSLTEVCGISIQPAANGSVIVNVATTGPVHYRAFRLGHPERLVVDLEGARKAMRRGSYPAPSPILSRVRVAQFQAKDPATVRVVSDLQGDAAYNVVTSQYGIQIEVKPRGPSEQAESRPGKSDPRAREESRSPQVKIGQRNRKAPDVTFPVHKPANLAANLTTPKSSPQGKPDPLAQESSPTPSPENLNLAALVSGVSVQPGPYGDTFVDIATTRSIPYRVFQLKDPLRLVVDLKDARDASRKRVYPVESDVLQRVRVAQWRGVAPAVVRVVADLEGLPLFDVHAQRPGVRIELRPRQNLGTLIRNPFEYATQPKIRFDAATASTASPPAAPTSSMPGMADAALSGLKAIGYVEKPGAGTQAILSDGFEIYFVPEGGSFEKRFRVLTIGSNAVEVEDMITNQSAWVELTP
jgi:AMIN domain